MHFNWNKKVLFGAVLLAVLSIGACGSKTGAAVEPQELEQEAGGSPDAEEKGASEEDNFVAAGEGAAAGDNSAAAEGGRKAEETEEAQVTKPAVPGVVNPIREAEGSSDFEAIGVSLKLPERFDGDRNILYSIIDGKIAQIQFYDTIAESDAMVRAADRSEEDISGIYYVFDDSKKQNWFTVTEGGERIEITVQATVENSDVPGALATWTCGETQYSLWEDSVGDAVETTAKMAIDIARASADISEE